MKKILFTLSVSILAINALAQIPAIQWEQSYGGSSQDNCLYVSQTSDSGFIACGNTTSTNGQVTGDHAASTDFWVTKISSAGVLQWEKALGGSNTDAAHSVQQTVDGGYAVAGVSNSVDGDVTGNHGLNDFWMVKLDDTGGIQWENSYGGSSYEQCNAMVQTSDSGYILVGFSESSDGDVTVNHGLTDVWIVKLNAAGSIQWQKSFGGSGGDLANAVRQTTDGGYIVAGYSNSVDGDVTGNHGGGDYWVLKLSASGSLQWQKSLGGSYSDNALGISQTMDGGYILTGSSGSIDTAGSEVTGHRGPGNVADMWTVKINDTGAIEWERSLGSSLGAAGYSVIQTPDSGYMSFGYANFSTDSVTSDCDVTNPYGFADYWMAKLSPSGALLEQKTFGGSSVDYGYSVNATSDGGFVLGGTSESSGGEVTGNHGSYDFWIIKLQGCDLSVPVITAAGHTLSTSASSGVTYQWTVGGTPIPGATNAAYTAATNGSYAVIVTNTSGCSATSAAHIISGLAVYQLYNSPSISVFPNPTAGNISVMGITNATIKVYDLPGQLIKEENNTGNISIDEFPAGMYFIGVFNEQGQLLKKEKIVLIPH